METPLEYAYGIEASVNGEVVDSAVIPMGKTSPVWYPTVEEAEEAMKNDLRFINSLFIIARPKVKWFRLVKTA